jgi:hypothetical protein
MELLAPCPPGGSLAVWEGRATEVQLPSQIAPFPPKSLFGSCTPCKSFAILCTCTSRRRASPSISPGHIKKKAKTAKIQARCLIQNKPDRVRGHDKDLTEVDERSMDSAIEIDKTTVSLCLTCLLSFG